jgi:hypothetical protein
MGKYNINNKSISLFQSFSRIMKNRVVYKTEIPSELNHPLRIAQSGRKEHISEPKQAIRKSNQLFILLLLIIFFRK